MPGNGSPSNAPLLIILKNNKGNTISKIDSDSDCSTLYDSINIEWDLTNDIVWYAKAKYINLKTGEVEC